MTGIARLVRPINGTEDIQKLDRWRLLLDQVKEMEHRYHTWMNYYSLFNGALLVAYCTILVSTGKVISLEGNVDTASEMSGGAKVFFLNCTYWDVLTLIAFLGVIASYCWYLSMIGHKSWIESWRGILRIEEVPGFRKELGIEDPSIERKIQEDGVLPHFHSTYKVTMLFICGVMFAWICIMGYSFGNHELSFRNLGISLMVGGGLIIIELFLHCIIGSDLSGFIRYKKAEEKNTDAKESEVKNAIPIGDGNTDIKEENKSGKSV